MGQSGEGMERGRKAVRGTVLALEGLSRREMSQVAVVAVGSSLKPQCVEQSGFIS